MNNMESLYESFKYYFEAKKEKINYFLDVLKNVKEDKWEYECNSRCELDGLSVEHYLHETQKIIYDNIVIIHYVKRFLIDREVEVEKILVLVDNIAIFQIQDETSELSIEILDFIERAEKRAKGE